MHGEAGLAAALRITEALFRNTLAALAEADLQQLAQDGLPVTQVDGESIGLSDALVESGLAVTPRGEVTLGQARKLVQSNAVSVNGEKVMDESMQLTRATALYHATTSFRRAKKVIT